MHGSAHDSTHDSTLEGLGMALSYCLVVTPLYLEAENGFYGARFGSTSMRRNVFLPMGNENNYRQTFDELSVLKS
jgi:hypothetical protein